MSASKRSLPAGIEEYHQRSCRIRNGGKTCDCLPSYRARFRIRGERFDSGMCGTLNEAINFMQDTKRAVRDGTYIETTKVTVRVACAKFIAGAREGSILNRKGETYRPSTVRDYEGDLEHHVLEFVPEGLSKPLGDLPLADVRRGHLHLLIDHLVAKGLKPSTIRNAFDPLRRVFTRALERDQIPFSPCTNLALPKGTGTRDRIASVTEADTLIAALPKEDQGLWATLFFSGLRMGDLRGLTEAQVDLDAKVFRVEGSWDDKEGAQDRGKSHAATRTVAIIDDLRPYLLAHRMLTGRRGTDLFFGATATQALTRSTVRRRALKAWGWKEIGTPRKLVPIEGMTQLEPITPHECRHTYGSMIAAAGWDVSERQRQMGHASSTMMDRYTHATEGSVQRAGDQLQAWLDQQRQTAG